MVSEIKLPKWLPEPIAEIVQTRILNIQKNAKGQKEYEVGWAVKDIDVILKILPLFTDRQMLEVWEKLIKKDKDKSVMFCRGVFSYFSESDPSKFMAKRLDDKLAIIQMALEGAKEFAELLEFHSSYTNDGEPYIKTNPKEYISWETFYGTRNYLNNFIKSLERIEKPLKTTINSDEYKQEKYWYSPVTKKSKAESDIYYMRVVSGKLTFFFKKPFHNELAIMINCVFGTSYNENDVIKLTSKIRKLQKNVKIRQQKK